MQFCSPIGSQTEINRHPVAESRDQDRKPRPIRMRMPNPSPILDRRGSIQNCSCDMNKEGGCLDDVEHAAQNQLGFQWDPTSLGTPKPVFAPMRVYGLTLYLVKPPLLGQCIWWMPLPLPLRPKESIGRQGRHFVHLPGPLSRERRFTRYIANP